MQTFVPYENFAMSAQVLDRQRLGKQRVETMQIMFILCGQESRWSTHPAVKMWVGYEDVLMDYQDAIIDEWSGVRGYQDNCRQRTLDAYEQFVDVHGQRFVHPSWLGGEIHASHRSNLLRKDPEWYGRFGWTESDDLKYFWP